MAKPFPLRPAHPERVCWGCDLYCPVDDLRCGNGAERTQHPIELYGEGWETWGLDPVRPQPAAAPEVHDAAAAATGAAQAPPDPQAAGDRRGIAGSASPQS